MPYTKKENTIYQRGYQAGLRAASPAFVEAEKARKWQWYQRHLDERRAADGKKNRKRGHKPRPKGARAKEEIPVPAHRRWRLFDGRIYFTSKKGFEPSELREILRQVSRL